jgi:RTX calcium-binding nonapeptide repeat (4 copies)
MARSLAAAVGLLLATAPGASAGTITGRFHEGDGTTYGQVRYHATAGVENRVTVTVREITTGGTYIQLRDRAERVRAGEHCTQLDRHTARCPWTESEDAIAVLAGDRDDRVNVERSCHARGRCLYTVVRGGPGDDVITGGGWFYGGGGRDIMRGIDARYSWDRFHGGPGRDRMEGRGAFRGEKPWEAGLQDQFYDDETDAQAARDVVIGGRDARASIDYSVRKLSMEVDLHDARLAPEGDIVSGVKSITTGAGNDVIVGTGGPNSLAGGPGRDRLYGRRGDDTLTGGTGADRMFGQAGDDALGEPAIYGVFSPGDGGRDVFVGGAGTDEMRSVRSQAETTEADDVRCDSRDKPVFSDASDRLRGCRVIAGWDIGELEMRTRPVVGEDGASFTLRCAPTEFEESRDALGFAMVIKRCRGRLMLRSTDGDEYGSREFEYEMEDYRTPWVTVTVPLTDSGRRAVERGDVIEVEAEALSSNGFRMDPAGYRSVLG